MTKSVFSKYFNFTRQQGKGMFGVFFMIVCQWQSLEAKILGNLHYFSST